MDPRAQEAQDLLWELADPLVQLDATERLRKRVRMAELHESLGRELLQRGDLDGWINFFAGITAWGKAGLVDEARRMIGEGRRLAGGFPGQEPRLLQEFDDLASWLTAHCGGEWHWTIGGPAEGPNGTGAAATAEATEAECRVFMIPAMISASLRYAGNRLDLAG